MSAQPNMLTPPRDDVFLNALAEIGAALQTDGFERDRGWAWRVVRALDEIEKNLCGNLKSLHREHHRFAYGDRIRPTLDRFEDKIVRDYRRSLLETQELRMDFLQAWLAREFTSQRAALQRVRDSAFASFRQKTESLLVRLEHLRSAKIDLVFETLYTDLGGGD